MTNKQQPIQSENVNESIWKDGKFEMELNPKYADFLRYYLHKTGVKVNEKEILDPNEYFISYTWFVMQVAKLYDCWQQERSGLS